MLLTLLGAAAEQQANPLVTLFPFVLIGLALYFVMIRPQRKRQQQQQALLNQLEVGDEVLTIGGIFGTIRQVDDEAGELTLEIAPGTTIRVVRSAVGRKVEDEDETTWDEDSDDADPESGAIDPEDEQ